MQLSETWDMFPRNDTEYFTTDNFPELNMQSALFCLRGAWIYPVTSGQEITIADGFKEMTVDELLFAYEYQLTQEQMVIFKEMREYVSQYPELGQNNVIFAFEGLGNYSGATNSCHPNGQFGALFIVCKAGKPEYAMFDGSTLPDRKNNAVIEDGVYNAVYWNHKGNYSGLQLRMLDNRNNDNIPARRYDGRQSNPNSANGINLHMAGKITESSGWSLGCLTVEVSKYYEFGINANFIKEQNDGKDYTDYGIMKGLKTENNLIGDLWGNVVVDRKYMDEEERDAYFEN